MYFNNLNLFDIRIDTQSEVTQKAQQVGAALDLVAGTERYTTKQNKQRRLTVLGLYTLRTCIFSFF